MVDDILLSPEEQDERAKQWFKDNGLALFVGLALGLGAIFGYNQYQAKKLSDAENASTLYNEILGQISASDIVDIDEDVATLKANHADTSYAAKAILVKAARLSLTDLSAAVQEYQWVRANAPEIGLQHTARIREAKIHLSQGNLDLASELASQPPYGSFASHYYEILGDIAVEKDELSEAFEFYNQATESLLSSDASYANVLSLKMAPLPKPEEEANVIDSAE